MQYDRVPCNTIEYHTKLCQQLSYLQHHSDEIASKFKIFTYPSHKYIFILSPKYHHPNKASKLLLYFDCRTSSGYLMCDLDSDAEAQPKSELNAGWFFLTGTPPKSSKYKEVNLGRSTSTQIHLTQVLHTLTFQGGTS